MMYKNVKNNSTIKIIDETERFYKIQVKRLSNGSTYISNISKDYINNLIKTGVYLKIEE